MQNNKLFRKILHMLWVFILFAGIGGTAAWYFSIYLKAPVYEAEATVYAMNRSKTALSQGGIVYQDIVAGRQFLQDYSPIIHTRKVTSLALAGLKNYTVTEKDLIAMTEINLPQDSSVMGIRALSNNPALAADAANAVSRAFAAQMQELTGSDVIGILDEAKIPEAPVPDETARNIVIGMLAGMALVFAALYLNVLFDTTIREAEDVEYALKLPVVGVIPEHSIR